MELARKGSFYIWIKPEFIWEK